jgi:hypothetical protein
MKNKKVKYIGCSDEQVKWGNNDDPRNVLTINNEYMIVDYIEKSWHTKLILQGFEKYKFNSVCFSNPY